MICNNLNLQEFLVKFHKNDVVNNNKDIFLRFKEKMCLAVHIFIATFFCLSNW
jgi:hypothetical protein